MTTIETITADQALKARHRALWALGDYPAVAREVIPELGRVLVDADRNPPRAITVLDVAAGSGNAAIPAALCRRRRRGVRPHAGAARRRDRRSAEKVGVDVRWDEADAEALPYPDAAFDVVLSSVGVMFAPHHQDSADELLRVTRPGGTIGLINWTPAGFIGELFRTMKPYAPTPPPGVQPPPLWGDEEHVRALFGDRVTGVVARRQTVTVDGFATPEAWRDFFKAAYGPTIATYRSIANDAERVAALDRELAALARRYDRGVGSTVMDWEYLLFVARRV